MNAWRFLQDQLRLILAFCLGIVLVLAVIVCDAKVSGFHVPWTDALYAGGLGLLMLAIGFALEYAVRRPVYRELAVRQRLSDVDAAATLPIAGTAEQRVWARLLRSYHQLYLRQLQAITEQCHFYELFLTRFAHQMKTPLTVIQLVMEELRDAAGEGVERQQRLALLDSLAEERDRLDANLDLILQTARLTSFRFDARMESVDIVALLRDAVNEHKAAWIRRSLYPRIEADGDSVLVYTDRKWMRFIIDQFLRNALQYGVKPGTSEGTPFRIVIRRHPDIVSISFVDQGIGIPERDLRRVFDPFFTGANGRTYSRATGMGLYLVKQVCERLGHRVEVSSKENEGTTFTLTVKRSAYFAPMADD
jgi:OmpR family two-component system sensor histidine kinase YxdK